LVPGGGPSLDGQRWLTTNHPTQKNRRKPFLVNNEELGREFRKQFIAGLRRLLSKGKLRLEGNVSWLQDETQREAWLHELESTDWNVFIEGPPHGKSKPTQVIKYLARYMSGGPLADSRLISHRDGEVTFWARSKDKANKSEPFTLRGEEFVRRWSMHCLPKGYTRSRSYGGFHCGSRAKYLDLCRKLLPATQEDESSQQSDLTERPEPSLPKCDRCQAEMICVASSPRPSWREVFTVGVYRDQVYSPTLHIDFGNIPQAHPIGGYG
jgi:hypothetical protein